MLSCFLVYNLLIYWFSEIYLFVKWLETLLNSTVKRPIAHSSQAHCRSKRLKRPVVPITGELNLDPQTGFKKKKSECFVPLMLMLCLLGFLFCFFMPIYM